MRSRPSKPAPPKRDQAVVYCSSVSESGLGLVAVIVSDSVTRMTPGTGSSITSTIVSSTIGFRCLGAFFGAFFKVFFDVTLAAGLRVFFLGAARLTAFLRAGLAFLPFTAFLRVALRFFALAMAVSCEVSAG